MRDTSRLPMFCVVMFYLIYSYVKIELKTIYFSIVNSSTQNIMKNRMKRLKSSLERKLWDTDKAMIHKIYKTWWTFIFRWKAMTSKIMNGWMVILVFNNVVQNMQILWQISRDDFHRSVESKELLMLMKKYCPDSTNAMAIDVSALKDRGWSHSESEVEIPATIHMSGTTGHSILI